MRITTHIEYILYLILVNQCIVVSENLHRSHNRGKTRVWKGWNEISRFKFSDMNSCYLHLSLMCLIALRKRRFSLINISKECWQEGKDFPVERKVFLTGQYSKLEWQVFERDWNIRFWLLLEPFLQKLDMPGFI